MVTETRFVCVPGLGLRPPAWHPFLRAAQPVGQAVASLRGQVAVLPGYGVRPGPDDPQDPVGLARLLRGVALDGRRPAVLLGHSASCQVVAHAAAMAPTAVQALVLVGPTTDPQAPTWRGLARRWLATAVHETPRQLPTLLRWYRETGVGSALRVMEAARHDDIRVPLRQTRCPVLVVRGWHDRICPSAWARELAATGPAGSRALTLPGGAHMVPFTHPVTVADAVTDFLRWGVHA